MSSKSCGASSTTGGGIVITVSHFLHLTRAPWVGMSESWMLYRALHLGHTMVMRSAPQGFGSGPVRSVYRPIALHLWPFF